LQATYLVIQCVVVGCTICLGILASIPISMIAVGNQILLVLFPVLVVLLQITKSQWHVTIY